jgi:sigma-B regulation protein RsbU (phosphoserine phosphatase)
LIVDLLDFTQARVGTGISVVKAAIDLHEAVAEILDGQRLAFPDRVFTHTRTGSGACHVDVNRLAQLVSNLVANAVAYGRKDAPIDVATSVTLQACSLAVTNAGEPIPAAALATLFQPMTRGTSASSKGHSVGLGLFIVQEIAKAHAGVASVRSAADTGTTFTVELPR